MRQITKLTDFKVAKDTVCHVDALITISSLYSLPSPVDKLFIALCQHRNPLPLHPVPARHLHLDSILALVAASDD